MESLNEHSIYNRRINQSRRRRRVLSPIFIIRAYGSAYNLLSDGRGLINVTEIQYIDSVLVLLDNVHIAFVFFAHLIRAFFLLMRNFT